MRFAFVGGLDVPDWLLSEVFVLSKISAVRIKLLCKHVVERELGRTQEDKVGKLLGESKLDEAGVKAVVAAVQFILSAAARHDVAEEVLAQELQQLGLPREQAVACHRFCARAALSLLRCENVPSPLRTFPL